MMLNDPEGHKLGKHDSRQLAKQAKPHSDLLLSQWDFSQKKFGLPFLGKASCNRVALPNLRCKLGVLVFP